MTPAHWAAALAERFALGAPRGAPGYVTRGAMGEIWRLDTTRGRWAVKWQFPWAPTDPRPPDLAVQAAAAQAGIPLPRPVTTPAGDAVVPVEGRHTRVYEWVDTGPPLAPPVRPDAAAQAGRLLGALHRLALVEGDGEVGGGPIDPWYTTPPAGPAWDDLARRAAAASAPWAEGLAAARPLIADLTALAAVEGDSGGQPIVCHRDFTPDNVLPFAGADGELIVLDWEDSGPLPPGREFGGALLAWCGGYGEAPFDATAAAALAGGYAATAGHQPRVDHDCFGTAAAAHLNFLHGMAAQALDDPQHRQFAERQLADLLGGGLDGLRRDIAQATAALGG